MDLLVFVLMRPSSLHHSNISLPSLSPTNRSLRIHYHNSVAQAHPSSIKLLSIQQKDMRTASDQASGSSFTPLLDDTITALRQFTFSSTMSTFRQVELPTPFRFLDLPGELRNQVYTELLDMLLEPSRCVT